jgi:flagellar basal body-associated protein FliL
MNKIFDILGLVSRILLIIILTATSLLSIGTAYIMFAPDELPKPFRLLYDFGPLPTPVVEVEVTPEVEYKPGEGIIVTTGTKIINMAGTNGNKYIRVAISLEFVPPDAGYAKMAAEAKTAYLAEFNAEIAAKQPVIDDTIITTISLKTFDNLYTADGKEKLRNELLEKLSEKMHGEEVLAVYFTEFVIN